eukprot:2292577-Rhodomonas_salina.1
MGKREQTEETMEHESLGARGARSIPSICGRGLAAAVACSVSGDIVGIADRTESQLCLTRGGGIPRFSRRVVTEAA